MDEIRQGGYCGLCRDRNMAELLGECVTKQVGLIKKYNPNAEIYIWSDMLDPNVNAVNDYFMVRGNFYGSWRNISKSIHPVIWVFDTRNPFSIIPSNIAGEECDSDRSIDLLTGRISAPVA